MANVRPGEILPLLQSGNAGTIDQFLRLLSENPLGEKAPGLVIHALKFLDIKKFVVGKLGVEFKGVAVGLGHGVIVVVDPRVNDTFLLPSNLFLWGLNLESL